MKIRTGFVSNSSSSSFVVAFPRIPQNVDDMKKMLFGDEESYFVGDKYTKISITAEEAATTVFRDFLEQGNPASFEEISKTLKSDISFDTLDKYKNGDGSIDWDGYNYASAKYGNECTESFMKKNEGKFIFIFSYADEDGAYFSAMEHQGLFTNLEHERISNH